MKKAEQATERKVFVTIRSGRSRVKLETWRYWEIVGELQFMHETRIDAVDAAKWCIHAKPGAERILPGGTTIEITEGKENA